MARTVIPVTIVERQTVGVWTTGAGTAVDPTNDMKFLYQEGDQIVLAVYNSAVAAKTVTLKASTANNAFMKGQGDLVITVAAGAIAFIQGMEQTRFKNSDGYVYVDLEAGITGYIVAAQVL